MYVDVLVGLQWGDEGKGKIVDYLSPNYNMIARYQGGPNAGHTLKVKNESFVLHIIPSGIFNDGILNLIGNGVVIDPIVLSNEILKIEKMSVNVKEKLLISRKAHLIIPSHKLIDASSEFAKGKFKIGSTLRGIGPAYMDKTGRNGLRMGDVFESNFKSKYNALKDKHIKLLEQFDELPGFDIAREEDRFFDSIEHLRHYQIIDSEYYINSFLKSGKKVLAEGAQGTMLDIDFGTYPYITSSNTVSAGVSSGLGVAPTKIKSVIGISKAYTTRVGSGPFPTELFDETGNKLRDIGHEYGATTGRERRCGWIDLPQLKYAIMINGVTEIALTKLDVLNNFEEVKACTSYKLENGIITDQIPFDLTNNILQPQYIGFEGWKQDINSLRNKADLPGKVLKYVNYLEKELEVPIKYISVGPERNSLLTD